MFREFFGTLMPPFLPFHYLNRQAPSLMATSGEVADQNTASSRLVSKTPDQRDSRNQIQKRPGDGTWVPFQGWWNFYRYKALFTPFKRPSTSPVKRGRAAAARQAHILKVVGSNPACAT